MTDDLESGFDNGSGGQPNPQASQGQGGEQTSFDPQVLAETLSKLDKRLQGIEATTRTLQGDKDRGVAKVSKEVGELKATLAEFEKLKEKGLSSDEAIEQMELKRDIAELKQMLSNGVSNKPVGSGGGGQSEVENVISEFGLSADDPQVASVLSQGLSQVKLGAKLAELKALQANRPAPTQAQQPAIPGSAQVNKSVDELTMAYKQDMVAARGKPNDLRAIREKYQKQGVPIHEVDFSG